MWKVGGQRLINSEILKEFSLKKFENYKVLFRPAAERTQFSGSPEQNALHGGKLPVKIALSICLSIHAVYIMLCGSL